MAVFTEHGFIFCILYCVSFKSVTSESPLYPYTSPQRAIVQTEGSYHLISSSIPVVYEERSFKSFVISTNGLVAFTTDTSKADFNNVDWSKDDVSPFLDIPFIAPYYHDGERIGIHRDYKGSVEYEQHGPANPDNRTLRDLGKYCTSQVVGDSYFIPTWGIVITWRNVTSKACQGSSCPSNTFQLVLLTDGTDSFAIFNYEKMDVLPCESCQAGLNGGNKTGWTDIISRRMTLRDLKNRQSSDTIGRYVFKISPGRVVRAGCSTDSFSDQLSIYPSFAGMFGGKMIDVSGPCFERSQPYRCTFGQSTDATDAMYISPNRVRCMVPRLMVRDTITLSLLANGKKYSTDLFIVYPGRLSGGEHVNTVASKDNMAWSDKDPSALTLTWQPQLLSNNSNDHVEINLIGYKEHNEMGSYKLLTSLGHTSASAGNYTVDPTQHQCLGPDCEYEIGLLEVKLMGKAYPMKYMYLSSGVIPLAWFVKTSMLAQYGTTWPTDMCVKWYNQDKQNMSWLDDLLHCPCSLTQAVSDFGRWQPDGGCNLQNAKNSNNCFYHTTAVHCVRAVQPVRGAGNQCCYSSTGLLIYAEDTFQGSTPDKGHDWGAAPYAKKGYVPSLSHWLNDVVTFYYCCLWTGYNSCDYYMDQRPTKNCAGYNPPIPASVYGQGHVMTFGGISPRRMYGPGDYVLFRSGNTEIQGRFNRNPYPTEKPDSHMIMDMVTLVGVAVQDKGTSDRVEIQLRGPEYDRSTQHLNVRVNGQYIPFNEKSLFWQDHKGVAIVNTDDRNEQSNFTVLLTNGIGFQIAETADTLQMDLMVPRAFNNVSGLCGTLSGDMLLPNGTNMNMMYLRPLYEYNKFQLAWAVQENGSLFQTLLPANNSLLGPVTVEPAPLNDDTPSYCKGNQECIYDYRHTGSEAIARSSGQAAERYAALHKNLQPVRSCGILDVPRSKKTNYDYKLGATTTIISCRVGQLTGTATYTCVETSNTTQAWSPAVDAVCHDGNTDGALENTTPSNSMTTVYRDCNNTQPNCDVLNKTLGICKDIRNAVALCQKFCGLCNVVNGGWADWGNFSTCDVTCGNGTKLRTRECSSPKPENGGLECEGSANETLPCEQPLCPVHGGWSEWEKWGTCSVTCGAGLRRRDRNCDNPYPSADGHHCFGESINYEICNKPSCYHLDTDVVMFTARNLTNTSLHSNEDAIYIQIETNDGEGYSNVTGKFTAPVSGLYTFTVQYCVKLRQIGNLELVHNGNPLQRGEIVGAEYAQCGSLQALSKVQKGDRVWVRCTNDSQFYQDEPYRWATFSGALIHRFFSESVSGQIFVG